MGSFEAIPDELALDAFTPERKLSLEDQVTSAVKLTGEEYDHRRLQR